MSDEDKRQYWLMIDNSHKVCSQGIEFTDESEDSFTGWCFDSLAELIVWASENHIALNKTKIVIGKESRLKLELV